MTLLRTPFAENITLLTALGNYYKVKLQLWWAVNNNHIYRFAIRVYTLYITRYTVTTVSVYLPRASSTLSDVRDSSVAVRSDFVPSVRLSYGTSEPDRTTWTKTHSRISVPFYKLQSFNSQTPKKLIN